MSRITFTLYSVLLASAVTHAAVITLGPEVTTSGSTAETTNALFRLTKPTMPGWGQIEFSLPLTVADLGASRAVNATNSATLGFDWQKFASSFDGTQSQAAWGLGSAAPIGDPHYWVSQYADQGNRVAPGYQPTEILVTLTEWFVSPLGAVKRAAIRIDGDGAIVPEPTTAVICTLFLVWCLPHRQFVIKA